MTAVVRNALLVLLMFAPFARADTDGLIVLGNELYRDNQVADALETYRHARSEAANEDDPILLYNQATAHAAAGEHTQAELLLSKIDVSRADPSLARNAKHNLGNAIFNQARVMLSEGDAEQALERMAEAEDAYLAAYGLDRTDRESARNAELVRQMRRMIEDFMQQSQMTPEQQQQQQVADQLKQLAEEQREAAEDSQDASEQQDQQQGDQNGQDQQGDQSQQDPQGDQQQQGQDQQGESQEQQSGESGQRDSDLSEQQQSISERTQEQADQLQQSARQMQQQEGMQEMMEALRRLQEARNEQTGAEQRLDQQSPGQASEHQFDAADLLEQAAQQIEESIRRQQQAQQGQQGEPQEGEEGDEYDPNGQDGDPRTDDLLDKERREREWREPYQRRLRRTIPVERDW